MMQKSKTFFFDKEKVQNLNSYSYNSLGIQNDN